MIERFNFKHSLILMGLLAATSISFGAHSASTSYVPMNRKAHQAAMSAYFASPATELGQLITVLEDLLYFQANKRTPNQAILLYLGAQLGVTTYELEDIISELQARITGDLPPGAEAAGASDDAHAKGPIGPDQFGGWTESKGSPAATPPAASGRPAGGLPGGAAAPSGARLSALANVIKQPGFFPFDLSLGATVATCQDFPHNTATLVGDFRQFFPYIGFYNGAGYRMRDELGAICGTAALFKKIAPGPVQAQLASVADGHLIFYINIFGPLESMPASTVNNVVFHPVVAQWLGNNFSSNFNVNINAGLFSPNGVTNAGIGASSIAFDSLQSLNVHYHDQHYSPNNGHFKLVDGREIATFWLVGTHDHAGVKHGVVTLNLIINQDSEASLGAKLRHDLNFANNLAELIQLFDRSTARPTLIERATRPAGSDPKSQDAQAVWQFTDLLEKLVAA